MAADIISDLVGMKNIAKELSQDFSYELNNRLWNRSLYLGFNKELYK